MAEFVYVTPAKGGRVRMADRGNAVMPAEGMFVPRTVDYERLIMTGDLVVDESRKFEPPKTETEDKPDAEAAPHRMTQAAGEPQPANKKAAK